MPGSFPPSSGAPGSPCNCREVFLVFIPAGMWPWISEKEEISVPVVSGLTAGGELSQCCSYSCWCCMHVALNPSRDGHSSSVLDNPLGVEFVPNFLQCNSIHVLQGLVGKRILIAGKLRSAAHADEF